MNQCQARSSFTYHSESLDILLFHFFAYQATHRVMPRFVAMTRTGARSLSSARLRNEKHSMSSMWTSSMKSTWTERKKIIKKLIVTMKGWEDGRYL